MISEFTIENFRLFEHLHLANLNQVNLFVGKNSVGKSAILEALRLYFSKTSQLTLLEILKSRREHLSNSDYLEDYKQNPCRHLFPNRHFPNFDESGIVFSTENDKYELLLSLFSRRNDGQLTQIDPKKFNRYSPETLTPYIVVKHQHETLPIIPLITAPNLIAQSSFQPLYEHNNQHFNHIPTNGIAEQQIIKMWSRVNMRETKNEIISALQLINPNIIDVDCTLFGGNDWVPMVRLSTETEPKIMISLGDGMNRIFQIILSLICSKDGALLIDEFETGLHWSVQQQAWKMIFTLAEKLNVQVFCTTHSKDCVESFEQVWSETPEQGSFYRIYRSKDEQIKVQDYDSELLSASIDIDAEVR